MGMPEDGVWRFGILGRDNGRVVRLVLEVGRGGEEETERELTRGWNSQKLDFSNMMRTLRCEISDLNSETSKRWDLIQKRYT